MDASAKLWLANCYFSKIPQNSPSCYHSLMRNLAVLFIHFIAVLARLLGPGGVRSLIAESLLLKHQILILNRSRKRSPNLHASDPAVMSHPGSFPQLRIR